MKKCKIKETMIDGKAIRSKDCSCCEHLKECDNDAEELEYKHQWEQEQLKLQSEAEEEAIINAESEQDSLDQLDQSDQEEYDGEEYGN
jgi:adenine deaminase